MNTPFLDFRSDTVTKPCKAMREAMATAEVDDDVYDECKTVKKLECLVAEMLSKDEGLFVPSGTMGNLIAAICHGTGRSAFPEIVVGDCAHACRDEVGNLAAVARCQTRQLTTSADGTISLDLLRGALHEGADIHYGDIRAVFIENTHGALGGLPLPLDYIEAVAAMVKTGPRAERGPVALHCDGARLWNAATAHKVPMATVAKPFDSVTVCLSKGIGAPVGSVLAGEKTFIRDAKRARKMLGGGMRQCGVLAAAAIVGVQQNFPKMQVDHNMATQLAEGLKPLLDVAGGDAILNDGPQTNMFMLKLGSAKKTAALIEKAETEANIRIGGWGDDTVRFVTHCNMTPEEIETGLGRLRDLTGVW